VILSFPLVQREGVRSAQAHQPVTDDHFSKALQKALQQPAVLPRTEPQAVFPQMKQPRKFAGAAASEVQLGDL